MSERVVKLIPNNALCADAESLAERITELAQRIKDGEFGPVERVCIVMDGDEVDYRTYGTPTSNAHLVGLLEWAKTKVILGD